MSEKLTLACYRWRMNKVATFLILITVPTSSMGKSTGTTEHSYEIGAVMCEAPGGHWSPTPLLNTGRTIRARITLVSKNPHRKWAPMAGLVFVFPGQYKVAGVQLYSMYDRPDRLEIGVKKPGRPPVTFANAAADQSIDVSATLHDKGRLTVTAGGISKTVRIGNRPVTGLMLMCSSGSFRFEKLSAPVE
jgi:hypothetical protein